MGIFAKDHELSTIVINTYKISKRRKTSLRELDRKGMKQLTSLRIAYVHPIIEIVLSFVTQNEEIIVDEHIVNMGEKFPQLDFMDDQHFSRAKELSQCQHKLRGSILE